MRELTPRPEYRPPALRSFEISLGESDAAVEWIEVSIRHLEQMQKSGGPGNLLEVARGVNVRVNPVPFTAVKGRSSGLAILAVFQHFEHFLRAFRRGHPRKVADRDDEDIFSYTLSAFGVTQDSIGRFEVEVVDYYREVRNHLMHSIGSDQRKVSVTAANRLRQQRSGRYLVLAAPNEIESLSFDDFVLFTRVVKHVARELCHVAAPNSEELRVIVLGDEQFMRTLKGEGGNRERMTQKIAKYIQVRFGFPATAHAVAVEILAMGPLAQG